MSIILDAETRVLVHGASGAIGAYQRARMIDYGTKVVGAVSRRREGSGDTPVYPTIAEAVPSTSPDLMVSYASALRVRDAAVEAFQAGVETVVVVAEVVPFRDIVAMRRAAEDHGCRLIGPNTNGVLTPGVARVGFFAEEFATPGPVGLISRSGTLAYGAMLELTALGLGVSTGVGIGGGLARGISAVEVLELFQSDRQTEAVVMLGEVGSAEEEGLAAAVAAGGHKPVVSLIVGAVGDEDHAMGHAGAVVLDGGRYASKIQALEEGGVTVAKTLGELAGLVDEQLGTARAAQCERKKK